jgi:uncharacterized protein YaaW (UPF0174 family)
MENKNLTVKEKMLIAAILKDYWERLSTLLQKQKSSLLGNNPMLLNIQNNELVKLKNWLVLEIACLELTPDMIELAVISNYAWKELDSAKKKEFIQKIKIFLLNDDAVVFSNKNSLVKPMSDLMWHAVFNNLNS